MVNLRQDDGESGVAFYLPPPRPAPGAAVALLSASSAAFGRFPRRTARAEGALREALGRPVRLVSEAEFPGIVAGSAKARANALRHLMEDPEVGLVMFSVGGFNSNDMLEHMASWAAQAPRKPLVGYSDSTAVLLGYQAMTQAVVFYGAAALPQFGEWPRPHRESVDSLVTTVLDGRPGEWALPDWYTQQDTDWAAGDEFVRASYGPAKPLVVREGTGGGVLFGGNLPTINLLAGTAWWQPPEGPTVLAVEATATSGQPEAMRRWLRHIRHLGLLDQVTAVLIGRVPIAPLLPRRTEDLAALVLDLLPPGIPVVADMPFGHTDPILTLPIGSPVAVTADSTGVSVRTLTETVLDASPAVKPDER
ncbi:LD-carboxypeptidase [Streptomyces sp. NPDC058665]|uniref:LD-carboxypeptidase n=1 Tax=Streptomyces sp. NPDC058665 TaxID=3346586 RepID=UPI00364A0371